MERLTPKGACWADIRVIEESYTQLRPGKKRPPSFEAEFREANKVAVSISCFCGLEPEQIILESMDSPMKLKNKTLQEARDHKKSSEHMTKHCKGV